MTTYLLDYEYKALSRETIGMAVVRNFRGIVYRILLRINVMARIYIQYAICMLTDHCRMSLGLSSAEAAELYDDRDAISFLPPEMTRAELMCLFDDDGVEEDLKADDAW